MINTAPRILVADDNRMARKLVTYRLTGDGYRVREAESGEEVLISVRLQPVELVLLDYRMEGISGLETLEALNGDPELRKVPVVVVSAAADSDLANACIAAGAADVLHKPVLASVLREVVEDLVGRARGDVPIRTIDLTAGLRKLPGLDPTHIEQLVNDHGKASTRNLVERFRDLAPTQCRNMRKAAETADAVDWTRKARILKCSARPLGLSRLSAACRAIEKFCENGQIFAATQLTQDVQGLLDQALVALRREAETL